MAPAVSSGFRRWWRHPRPGDTGGGVSGEVVRGVEAAGGVGEGAGSPPGQHQHYTTTPTTSPTHPATHLSHRLNQGAGSIRLTPQPYNTNSHSAVPAGGAGVPLTSSSAVSGGAAGGAGNRRQYPAGGEAAGGNSIRGHPTGGRGHTGVSGHGGVRWRRSPVGSNTDSSSHWRTTHTSSATAQQEQATRAASGSSRGGGSGRRPTGGGSGFHSQDHLGNQPWREPGSNSGVAGWGQGQLQEEGIRSTANTDRPSGGTTTGGSVNRLHSQSSVGEGRHYVSNSTVGNTTPNNVNVSTSTGSDGGGTHHTVSSVTSGVTPDPGGGTTTSLREHIISGNSYSNNTTAATQTTQSRGSSNTWVNDLITTEPPTDSTTALYSDYSTNSTNQNSTNSSFSSTTNNNNSTSYTSTLLREHLQNNYTTTTGGLNTSTHGGSSPLWESLSWSNSTSSESQSSSVRSGTEGYAVLNINNSTHSSVTNLPWAGGNSSSGGLLGSSYNNTNTTTHLPNLDSIQTSEPTTAFPGYLDLKDLPWEFSDYPDSLSMFGNLTDCGTGSMAWSGTNGTYGCWPGSGNGTNGTWPGGGTGLGGGGSDGMAPRYWALLLVVFPLFTIVGNILVVTSVYRERALRTVTNYFIVSLAIADIAVALFVMPLAIYTEVNNGTWRLGDVLCDAWVALDVMGCTSSILNLTAISVDRFIAVTQPIRYAKHKHSRRVDIMLAMTWIVSICISSPIALGMNYTEARSQTPELCIFYNSEFLICSSMGSFYIPCIVMLVLYWRIFRSIHLRAKKQKLKALKMTKHLGNDNMKNVIENKAQVNVAVSGNEQHGLSQAQERRRKCPIHGSPNRGTALATHAHNMTNNETSFTNVVTTTDTGEDDSVHGGGGGSGSGLGCEVIKSPLSDDTDHVIPNDKSTEFMLSPQSEDSHGEYRDGGDTSGYSPPVAIVVETQFSGNITSPTSPKTLLSPPPRAKSTVLGFRNHSACKLNFMRREHKESPRKSVTKFNFHLRHSKKKKQSSAIRRERKATKTLAIVLGVFLFCWLPFFTVNVMNAICIKLDVMHKPECNIDPMLMSFFVWLGYINSFLNPVIYTIFNIEFRKAFKNILINPLGKRL